MGHCGQALLLLQPQEEAYVEFLWLNQQVQLECLPRQPCSAASVISRVKKMAAKDRWDLAMCAVSSAASSHVVCHCPILVCLSVCLSVCPYVQGTV